MTSFHKYSSIEQFKDAIRTVTQRWDYQGKDSNGNAIYDHREDYPIYTFVGTTKGHGTNAATCYQKAFGSFWAQSRNRILTLDKDNAGFAAFAHGASRVYL